MPADQIHSYFAYGLGIHSALSLPGLVARDAEADVIIRLERVADPPPRPPDVADFGWVRRDGIVFARSGIGKFAVRGGREIVVEPATGVDERRLRHFLLSWVFSTLLHQRGFLLLHASAVEVNRQAIAFLGQRGKGKSTIASALYERGHGLITDDLTAVDTNLERPAVHPGFPLRRLWPDVIAALGTPLEQLRLPPGARKVRLVASHLPEQHLPLSRIYVLAQGDHERIEPIPPSSAVLYLVRNTYAVSLLEATHTRQAHLDHCARLVRSVSMYRLRLRRSLEKLGDAARFVEEDVGRGTAPAKPERRARG